ncbi:MAG: hypothetical protein EAZ89_07305, partial [Bacteroidetes bacterium]
MKYRYLFLLLGHLFTGGLLMAQPEAEPNNSFATANAITAGATVSGSIQTPSGSDANDYFYSILPDDGTLRYYVQYNNTSGSTGADF